MTSDATAANVEAFLKDTSSYFEKKKAESEQIIRSYETQLNTGTAFEKIVADSRIKLEKEKIAQLQSFVEPYKKKYEILATSVVNSATKAQSLQPIIEDLHLQIAQEQDVSSRNLLSSRLQDLVQQYQNAYENAMTAQAEMRMLQLNFGYNVDFFMKNVATQYLNNVEKPNLLSLAAGTQDASLKALISQFASYNQVADSTVLTHLLQQVNALEQKLSDARSQGNTAVDAAMKRVEEVQEAARLRILSVQEENKKALERETIAIQKLNSVLDKLKGIPQIANKVSNNFDDIFKAITEALSKPQPAVAVEALKDFQELVKKQKDDVTKGITQLLNNFDQLKISVWKNVGFNGTIESALQQYSVNPNARKAIDEFLSGLITAFPQLKTKVDELKRSIQTLQSSVALDTIQKTALFNDNLRSISSLYQGISTDISQQLQSRNFQMQQELTGLKANSEKLQTSYDTLQKKASDLQNSLNTVQNERNAYAQKISELQQQQGTTTASSVQEINRLKQSNTDLEKQINALNQEKTKLQKDIDSLNQQVKSAQTGAQVSTTQAQNVNAELSQLRQRNEILEKAFNDYDIEMQKTVPNAEELKKIVTAVSSISKAGNVLTRLIGRAENFQRVANANNVQLQESEKQRQALEQQLLDLQRQQQALQNQNKDFTARIAEQNQQLGKLKDVVTAYKGQFQILQQKSIVGLSQPGDQSVFNLLNVDAQVKNIELAVQLLLTNFQTQQQQMLAQQQTTAKASNDNLLKLYQMYLPFLQVKPNGNGTYTITASKNVDFATAQRYAGLYDNVQYGEIKSNDPLKYFWGEQYANGAYMYKNQSSKNLDTKFGMI